MLRIKIFSLLLLLSSTTLYGQVDTLARIPFWLNSRVNRGLFTRLHDTTYRIIPYYKNPLRRANDSIRISPGNIGQYLTTLSDTTVGWVNPIAGPQGPTGPTGPQGPTGPAGATTVHSGNGMNFTSFDTSGYITMGTPSKIADNNTNAVTTTSHTHSLLPFNASVTLSQEAFKVINLNSSYPAIYGSSADAGVYGNTSTGSGVEGYASGVGNGVYGYSSGAAGVIGQSNGTNSYGVIGIGEGYFGRRNQYSYNSGGVLGTSGTYIGVKGESTLSFGVYGFSAEHIGVFGFSQTVAGVATNNYFQAASANGKTGTLTFKDYNNNNVVLTITGGIITGVSGGTWSGN